MELLQTLQQQGIGIAKDEIEEVLKTELLLSDRELGKLGDIYRNSLVYQWTLCNENAHLQLAGDRYVTITKAHKGKEVCANCGGKL